MARLDAFAFPPAKMAAFRAIMGKTSVEGSVFTNVDRFEPGPMGAQRDGQGGGKP